MSQPTDTRILPLQYNPNPRETQRETQTLFRDSLSLSDTLPLPSPSLPCEPRMVETPEYMRLPLSADSTGTGCFLRLRALSDSCEGSTVYSNPPRLYSESEVNTWRVALYFALLVTLPLCVALGFLLGKTF